MSNKRVAESSLDESSSSSISDSSDLMSRLKECQQFEVTCNLVPKPHSDYDCIVSGKKKKPKKKKAKTSAGNHNESRSQEGEVSDNSDSDDGASKSGSSTCNSRSESEEECNDGILMRDDNDQACLASTTVKKEEDNDTTVDKLEYSSPGVLNLLQSIVESPQTYSVLPHEDWPEWPTNFSTPANETEFVDCFCNTENASSSTEYDHVRRTGDEKELILEPPAPGMQSVAFNTVDVSQLGQVGSVLPREDGLELPSHFSASPNKTEFVDSFCNAEYCSSATDLRGSGDENEFMQTFEPAPPVDSVLPHEDELGLLPIDFSALSNETFFIDRVSNTQYGSTEYNHVRRTGDGKELILEPPAPGMHSMESIVDVLQLGQGLASTEDSNESLPDLPFELLTFNYMEQPTEESASTVERKNFFTTRNDREAAIDLNRKMYHACMTLIRVLEDSLRANLEKQMQLIGSIEYLKSSGSKKTKGKKLLPNAAKINIELKLPSPEISNVSNTPKKSRGRPARDELSIQDRRLMELLGPYRVIRQGRNMVTLYPGDVRRLAIITAATIVLVPISDLTFPEDLSGLPEMYRETWRMAIELSRNGLHPGSPVEPFPPNIVLLTGLRGLLVESTRVEFCSSDIEKIGDPARDIELLKVFKSLFGGFSKPFVESFNLNGWKTPAKTPATMADPKAASADGVDSEVDESLFNTNADVQPSGIGSCVGGGAGCSFGGGEEEGHINGDGPTDHTPKRSKRIRTPVKHMFSPTTGERDWSDEDKQELVSHFEKFGFNGDFESLSKTLNVKNPKSGNSIRYLIEKFLEERLVEEWEVKINTVINQLRNTYPQSLFAVNFELALKLKSLFGNFPNLSEVGGISYRDCYSFLASLMGGHVPKGISLVSKHKLFSVFSCFVQQVMAASQNTSFPRIIEKKLMSDFENIGKLLADRRSNVWTAEESRARELIQSGDLEKIRVFYGSHAVLNPL